MKLIGISGKARSGKDTAASYLINSCGFIQYSFAKPIKDFFDDLFWWDERHREGDLKETTVNVRGISDKLLMQVLEDYFGHLMGVDDLYELWFEVFSDYLVEGSDGENFYIESGDVVSDYDISPRKAYQLLGTEFGRNIDSEIWIKLAQKAYDDLKNFENEGWGCSGMVIPDVRFENEAEWVRKNKGTLIHIERENLSDIVDCKHTSEGGIDLKTKDLLLINNGTIKDMHTELYRLSVSLGVRV